MVSPEKILEVKKLLRSGVPAGEIKNTLVKEGYSSEDIQKIFQPRVVDMRNYYLFFAFLFFIIGLYRVAYDSGLHFLLFSGGLFYVYYRENMKIKKT